MEYTFSEEGVTGKNLEEIFQSLSDKGQIRKLVCGKKHTLILTGKLGRGNDSPDKQGQLNSEIMR